MMNVPDDIPDMTRDVLGFFTDTLGRARKLQDRETRELVLNVLYQALLIQARLLLDESDQAKHENQNQEREQ